MKKLFQQILVLLVSVGIISFPIAVGLFMYKYQGQVDTFITGSFLFFIVVILPIWFFIWFMSMFLKE